MPFLMLLLYKNYWMSLTPEEGAAGTGCRRRHHLDRLIFDCALTLASQDPAVLYHMYPAAPVCTTHDERCTTPQSFVTQHQTYAAEPISVQILSCLGLSHSDGHGQAGL